MGLYFRWVTMITVSCPDCGKAYKLKPTLIGKKGRCKVCDSSFTIEDPSGSSVDNNDNEYAMPTPRQSPPATPEKLKPSKPALADDDEFAGLNSVGSRDDAVDELPELPPRRKQEASTRNIQSESATAPPKKKKQSSSSGGGFVLGGPISAILSAGIGGSIGAVIWGAIAYFAHAEVGYVAWGVGGLVGFCVRMGAGDMDEGIAGFIAAGGAVISILAGKLLAGYFIVQWLIKEGQIPAAIAAEAQWPLIRIAFMSSFGVVDIVFFVLAIATAFKLGSGQSDSD
ncbi:MAG: hypothetical protein JWP89_3301 [Schlesneria sp.]|nr:hypothetical protein [Schlesneria sp.]